MWQYGLPFDDICAKSGEEADHREADFIRATQHKSNHDRNERQLDIQAVPLSQHQPRDQHRKQRTRALHRLCERYCNVLQRQQTEKHHQKPTTGKHSVITITVTGTATLRCTQLQGAAT